MEQQDLYIFIDNRGRHWKSIPIYNPIEVYV